MLIKFPIDLLRSALELAKNNHPNEIILLLRGKKAKDIITINDFLIPPMGIGGNGFASFPANMLPIDFSIVGTLHSHPSGRLSPSTRDLHNMYGRVMVIIGLPYTTNSVSAFRKSGERLAVEVN
ncbi:peptidase [Candidatus Bathyarchaeota archaeon]|nr:peptidase [Candidatus Bathyarchaeota archaeon]